MKHMKLCRDFKRNYRDDITGHLLCFTDTVNNVVT